MAFENRFRYPSSLIPETFSGRAVPCHFEPPAQRPEECDRASDGKTAVQDECPFRPFCRATAPSLESLFLRYGKSIAVTLTEQSSSISVRSEHRFDGADRFRLTLRKHLFEVLPTDRLPDRQFSLHPESLATLQKLAVSQQPPIDLPAGISQLVGSANTFLSRDQFSRYLENWLSKYNLTPQEYDFLRRLIQHSFSSSLYCHALTPGDGKQLGEYVGFVDLRENRAPSSLALAVLKPPRSLRSRSDVLLLTGEYSKLFGGPAFEGSIYSAQEGERGGVTCADACLVMVLGMLSDRVPTLEGGFDLAYLAAISNGEQLLEKRTTAYGTRGCLGENKNVEGSFRIDGLTGVQMAFLGDKLSLELARSRGDDKPPDEVAIAATLLRHKRARDDYWVLSREQKNEWLLRIIEANLLAKFPMILNVDSHEWTRVRTGKLPNHRRRVGHAVVIVGLSGNLSDAGSSNLIVHDPGVGPFVEIPFKAALDAARALRLKNSEQCGKRVSLVTFYLKSSIPAEVALRKLEDSKSDSLRFQSHLEAVMTRGRIDLIDPRDTKSLYQPTALGGIEAEADSELLAWFKTQMQPYWRFLAVNASGAVDAAFVQASRTPRVQGPIRIGTIRKS